MHKEQKELRHIINHLMWAMRGGLTREDAWTLSYTERAELLEDVKARMENVEKTGLPIV
jgi:hypothetical protein